MFARKIFHFLSPMGTRGKLFVFIFHRVLPELDALTPWEPDAAQFDWMINLISRNFTLLPLSEAVEKIKSGQLPPAAASITFDDGYADNLLIAAPILKRHNASATFFIATDYLDGGRMWNDDVIEGVRLAPVGELDLRDFEFGIYEIGDTNSRLNCYQEILGKLKYFDHHSRTDISRSIARKLGIHDCSSPMLTTKQLQELHALGMDIGGHTQTHPILELATDAQAKTEILGCREQLEHKLGTRINLFAYPNGIPGKDYSARHAEFVRKAGFSAAVSTHASVARRDSDLYQLPRFTPWDRSAHRFSLRCASKLWSR